MDLRLPFYQQLLALGLVRVQRKDGSVWWVGQHSAEEQVLCGEATLLSTTLDQAKEMDEAE
jgi:hypothetical protein